MEQLLLQPCTKLSSVCDRCKLDFNGQVHGVITEVDVEQRQSQKCAQTALFSAILGPQVHSNRSRGHKAPSACM